MRYEVFGFNQADVVKQFSGRVETEDLLLLDYIIDAAASPKMTHIIKDGVAYVWLNQRKILEDLPVLNIKPDTLKRKLRNLEELKLIQTTISYDSKGRGGSRVFYSITDSCYSLRYESSFDVEKNPPQSEFDVEKNPPQTTNRGGKKSTSYNLLRKTDKQLEKTDKDIVENRVDLLLNNYHRICNRLSKVRALPVKRRKAILDLLRKHTMEEVLEVFQKANDSDFLCGVNDRGWKADLDFILREDKFVSILEGKYSGKSSVSATIEHGASSSGHRANIEQILEDIRNGNAEEF